MTTKRKQAKKPTGPGAIRGSQQALKHSVAIIQTLSGLSSPTETSAALSISPNRYYQLETRALQGLVSALEPRPRGRQMTPERERELLKAENERLKKELLRYQALARAAQRTIGLAKSARKKAGSKAPRRRPRVRAKTVLRTLETINAPQAAETED